MKHMINALQSAHPESQCIHSTWPRHTTNDPRRKASDATKVNTGGMRLQLSKLSLAGLMQASGVRRQAQTWKLVQMCWTSLTSLISFSTAVNEFMLHASQCFSASRDLSNLQRQTRLLFSSISAAFSRATKIPSRNHHFGVCR